MTEIIRPQIDLHGRVIAIAGAGGGLGPTVAARLAGAGATIAVAGRSQDPLDRLARNLGLSEDRWDARSVDMLDPDATTAWCAALTERFDSVDALLHLVGGWRGGKPIAEAPLSDYEWLHDGLVRTLQNTSRAFHNALIASEHGRFVLVGSQQAQTPSASNAAYAAAKAAAEAWTLALADSFADSAATANIVVVNAILTPQMREESPEKSFKAFSSAEDIADAIAYLCSDAAQKMNGQRLSLHS